ncbi:insulinase family protein [bacterium]|nr:insulinase family protein [bacterium]
MVRNISGLNSVHFSEGKSMPSFRAENTGSNRAINSISNITSDFSVKVPIKYTLLSKEELPNSLVLYNYKLSNGYKVSIVPMQDSPSVVKTYVNVGSLNETPNIKGISHFLEHMAFNGTNGEVGHMKLKTGDAFKKIDELGGWANASTNYAITDYVNSAPLLEESDLATQIKVLASMTEDLKLSDEMIEKEKGPVSSEINMILDSPQTVAMDQTVRSLYNIKNPADELVGGSVKHIKNLTRKDVLDYYKKYYTPDNINIVVTGDVNLDEVMKLISENFTSKNMPIGKRYNEKLTPINKTVRKDFVSDKAKSAEIVLGFLGPKNNSVKEKILYHIASSYLQSESTGLNKNLKPYHVSLILGDEKISTQPEANRFTYAGITSSEENTEKVLQTIFNTINNIKPISEEELDRIKEAIISAREDNFELSENVNNVIGNSMLDGNLDYTTKYNEILENITCEEVDSAIKQYFDLNRTAITVVHPEKDRVVSFKGKRMPINEDSVNNQTLSNNFDVGFYKTNSNKKVCLINFITDTPYAQKAGVRELLNIMYTMGTQNLSENELNKLKENLNVNIQTKTGKNGLEIAIEGNKKNYPIGLEIVKDLIYNPALTEENLQLAKAKLREGLKRAEITSEYLYRNEFYSKYDKDAFSVEDILKELDNITLNDIKDFHNYILNNSRGVVSSNISDEYEKEKLVNFISGFESVKPNNPVEKNIYKDIEKPVVLTSIQNNSQADIKQVYNFKFENNIKNKITSKLMNSILTNSSIGLFNTLREQEHLAYSVFSDVATTGDLGEISLNILTTTDNKAIDEKNYQNVQRSIEGFKRRINELENGNFTEQDLENAKRSLKAVLLNSEMTAQKVENIQEGLSSKYGINYLNKVYNEIDDITKDDIIDFAANAFSGQPVYAITATKDTLEANKEYLSKLGE